MKIITNKEDESIIIIAEMSINIDELSTVKNFCEFYADIVSKTETDTHAWSFFISEDDKSVTLVERYKNSRAIMKHVENISSGGVLEEHFKEFVRIFSFDSVKVLGQPSEELVKQMNELGMKFDFRKSIGGYTRI